MAIQSLKSAIEEIELQGKKKEHIFNLKKALFEMSVIIKGHKNAIELHQNKIEEIEGHMGLVSAELISVLEDMAQ